MMFQIKPNPVEPHKASHFIDTGIYEVATNNQRGFATAKFRFHTTETHRSSRGDAEGSDHSTLRCRYVRSERGCR